MIRALAVPRNAKECQAANSLLLRRRAWLRPVRRAKWQATRPEGSQGACTSMSPDSHLHRWLFLPSPLRCPQTCPSRILQLRPNAKDSASWQRGRRPESTEVLASRYIVSSPLVKVKSQLVSYHSQHYCRNQKASPRPNSAKPNDTQTPIRHQV